MSFSVKEEQSQFPRMQTDTSIALMTMLQARLDDLNRAIIVQRRYDMFRERYSPQQYDAQAYEYTLQYEHYLVEVREIAFALLPELASQADYQQMVDVLIEYGGMGTWRASLLQHLLVGSEPQVAEAVVEMEEAPVHITTATHFTREISA